MNIYFLVEGRSTEKKVYPKFIESIFEGKLTKVNQYYEVTNNNYFLLSGNGYPNIFTNILKNTILDINLNGSFDYLFICIDADETSIEQRKIELSNYLEDFRNEGIELETDCKIELIVQNRCIETWFLGNKKVYNANTSNEKYRKYQKFYNVSLNDPELMPIFHGFETHANFHFAYLREMLKDKNIRYTKKFPREVSENHYINQLLVRAEKENHLSTFLYFYNLCIKIKEQIK